MLDEKPKIKSFTDLQVWRDGHNFVLELYKITQKFPQNEQFGLVNQIRRAGVSFTSNIAEGFSRSSYKEKAQFYSISLGSLTEVQSQLLIGRDLGFVAKDEFDRLAEQSISLSKMTNGLIKKTKIFILTS